MMFAGLILLIFYFTPSAIHYRSALNGLK